MAKIELSVFYPHPPEHVWEALTNPEALAQWYMDNEGYAAEVGRRFILRAKPVMGWKGVAHCEMLAVEAPRHLRWSQRGGEEDRYGFTVSVTLRPEADGTRLTLVQDGLTGLRGFVLQRFMGAGWRRILGKRLPLLLDHARRRGWKGLPSGRRLTPEELAAEA